MKRKREERGSARKREPTRFQPFLFPFSQSLAAAARADKEEWVAVIGAAVGDFGGGFDLDAATKASAALRDAVATLEKAAADAGPAPDRGAPGHQPGPSRACARERCT